MAQRMDYSDGAYFHKQHDRGRLTLDESVKESAVVFVARNRIDGADFDLLVDMLGLVDTADRLHHRRSA